MNSCAVCSNLIGLEGYCLVCVAKPFMASCGCDCHKDLVNFAWTCVCVCNNPVYFTKDSGKRQVYSTGMQRDTAEGKARFDLCWKPLLWRWAELMARGAEKYGANNWQKASTQEELDRFKASAERHFQQWLRGDTDEDHAAAVLFNIAGTEFVKEQLK